MEKMKPMSRENMMARTLNSPLTPEGQTQGRRFGESFKDRVPQIDAVIVNSMQRTRQTAQEILKAFPENSPPFIEDNRFFERFVAHYEGKDLKVIEPSNKKDKEMSASGASFEEKMAFSPEEGIESYGEV